MNPGQEKFLNFIMERVDDENKNKAKELLNESFAKQNDCTFNRAYLVEFIPKMIGLIKEENIEEVKNIMTNFKG